MRTTLFSRDVPERDRPALRYMGLMGHRYAVVRTHHGGRCSAGESDDETGVEKIVANLPADSDPSVYYRAKGAMAYTPAAWDEARLPSQARPAPTDGH